MLNGIAKPEAYTVRYAGAVQQRFRLVYQEAGRKPISLCCAPISTSWTYKPPPPPCFPGQHVTALQARNCASAQEWMRRLEEHGFVVLQELRYFWAMQKLAASREDLGLTVDTTPVELEFQPNLLDPDDAGV